jgi:ankyrin repeat protein
VTILTENYKIMSSITTESQVREQTKIVLHHLEKSEIEEAQQIILNNKEILHYNFGLINFVPLIPRVRFSKIIPKNHDALKMVIDTGFQIFSNEDNVHELLFFAAAKCNIEKLTYCVTKILQDNPSDINQVREGDTALMFLIKYGNIADENCPECVKILIDAGIDVNRNDYFSHNPILFLFKLYRRYDERFPKVHRVIQNLRKCIELLLETGAINTDFIKIEDTNLSTKLKNLQFDCFGSDARVATEEKPTDKLFKYLINGNEHSFIKSKEVPEWLDADDGNNTFLQLCCEKNLKKAASFLIEKGADLCKTTDRNPKTPLELAARRNHLEIFEALLKTNKIVIDEALFRTFLRNRPKHIKAKYFDEILKYKNLDLNTRSNNGNTPLHYAIMFSSREANQALLQRGASHTVKNDSDKCPLDYISPEDLEQYLNMCVLPDSYTDFDNGKYEVALNYRSLITMNESTHSELTVVEKVCNNPKLFHLLNHPIMSSFIDIKWKLVEPLYKKLFVFHLVFYLISIFAFINLSKLLLFCLAIIYFVKIAVTSSWKNNKLHEIVDTVIAAIMLFSVVVTSNVIIYHLGIIATIFMAFSCHLFWRFSPNFAHFHAIMINILSHLFSYLSYIFILTLFFGAASYIFWLTQYDDSGLDKNFDNYVHFFNDVKMLLTHFYLLYVFGVFVSIVIIMSIIDSVAYLQENAQQIRTSFQILGYKNILIFLKMAEDFHSSFGVIKNPQIFDEQYFKDNDEKIKSVGEKTSKKERKVQKNRNKFLINFYINTNKFSFEKLLSIRLEYANMVKIKKLVRQ